MTPPGAQPVDPLWHAPPHTSSMRRLDQRYYGGTVVHPVPLRGRSPRLHEVVHVRSAPMRATEREHPWVS